MRHLIPVILVLALLPLLSFKIDEKSSDLIIGKWALDNVKPFPGTLSGDGLEQFRKYEGDEITFYKDNSVKYYKKSQKLTYNGSWKITKGERTGTARQETTKAPGVKTGPEQFQALEIDLGAGKKQLKILGEDLSVSDRKLYYTETKNGGKYWYFWVREN